jgi:hypothetical protein
MKKKATITVERERLLIISRARQACAWCEQCKTGVHMIGIDDAAAITGRSERTIFGLAERGEIHCADTSQGKTLFCLSSLLNRERWTDLSPVNEI